MSELHGCRGEALLRNRGSVQRAFTKCGKVLFSGKSRPAVQEMEGLQVSLE